MRSLYALLLCAGLALPVVASPAAAQCVSGTISVSVSNDPGFLGWYKYCVTTTWNLGVHDMSHLDLFLGLPDCPCICVCKGAPSLPAAMNGPAVKFQPDTSSTCDPLLAGSGTFCFYTQMPPG